MRVFILFFGFVLIVSKRFPQSGDLRSVFSRSVVEFFDFSHFLIFTQLLVFLLSISQEIFSINYLNLLVFLYQFSGRFRDFSLIDAPVFLYHLLLRFGDFSPTTMFIIYLHTQQSLHPRGELIVMTWSSNLVN